MSARRRRAAIIRGLCGAWICTCVTAAACRRAPQASTARGGGSPRPALAPDVPASPARPSTRTASPEAVVQVQVDRVTALDAARVLAVGAGRLWSLAVDHWEQVVLEGARPVDVQATRTMFWVLARGTGVAAGRAIILRGASGAELATRATPDLGTGSEPAALAVVRDGEYYVGGARPALARVLGELAESLGLDESAGAIVGLRYLRDESLVALRTPRGPGKITVVHWGERSAIDADSDYLDTLVDRDRNAYVVHEHGEFSRGRPGHEVAAVAPSAHLVVAAGGVLADGRPAVVASFGPFAVYGRHTWTPTYGRFPQDPVAILSTTPPLVVGRRGEIVAIEATGVREIVRPIPH